MRRLLLGSIALVSVAILWEVLAALHVYNPAVLPPPSASIVALSIWVRSGTFFTDLGSSLVRYGGGYALGAIVGMVAGALTGRNQALAEMVVPLLHFVRAIPLIALLPLVLLLFGIDDSGKIALIAWAAFFPVWLAVFSGARQVAVEHLHAARMLGAHWLTIQTRVVLPSTLPYLLTGLRTAVATAFFALAAGELVGGASGLAVRIFRSRELFHTDTMMAGILVLGIVALVTDLFIVLIARRVAPWADRSRA